MKNLKKILALALAVILTLSLCTVSFAADESFTISVPSDDTHAYDIYQIFTGDLSEGVLSNVVLGTNGKLPEGTTIAQALAALEAVTDSSYDDSAKLAVIENYVNLASAKVATVDNENSYSAAPGYYLIKDTAGYDASDNDAYTKYIVKIVGAVEINRKAGVPETEKKIVEGEDRVTVNEAGIGETITYEITGKIPAEAADYDYYYFIINDTMSEGLDFGEIVSVKCGDEDVAYTAKTGDDADPYTFQVALKDAKALAGKSVVVTCTAALNEKAVAGTAETNKENATYSNNPNFKYDGTNDEEHEGFPDSEKNVPTGETPDQEVKTYTTKLVVKKVDEKGNILTGAEFSLTGDTYEVKVSTTTTFEAAADGSYYKLADGKYTTEAPTEAYMKKAEAGAEKGYVIDNDYTKEDAIVDAGVTYRPYDATTDADKDVYIYVESNADLYDADSIGTKFAKKVKTSTLTNVPAGEGTDAQINIKAEVAADGTVSFEGLGAGNYVLTETKTPAGYNTIEPISFEVIFENETFSTDSEDIVLNADNALETTVVNEKGSTLPETGGIGTTIFYVIGGILIVGAAILLITKKRMSAQH